ncbi:hypothetical protein MVEN_00237500 [Mycena venus]|uniref:F-box domain-containing protein n=1 Tax=Mycena venus TaxID=2733690 RepID=A0A8H7DEE4_9AGAR|nr:hypothetical protein MVEN_00237500 [Mycena venus]
MPLLRYLDLDILDYSVPIDAETFGDVPLLRRVVLNDIAASEITLPWAQLTSLALNRVTLQECIPVLKQTPNLVHCELRLFYSEDDDGADVIALPCLESLAFNDPGDVIHPATQYLNAFVVPSLCHLRIPERLLGPNPLDSLTLFMSKSGSKVQKLCIIGERVVPRYLYRKALPSLGLSFSLHQDWMANPEEYSDESDSYYTSDASEE